MLDIKFIRQYPDAVRDGARKKRMPCDVDQILALDEEWRRASQDLDLLRARGKSATKAIGSAPAAARPALLEAQKEVKSAIKLGEDRTDELRKALDELLLRVPNVPAAEVPEGRDDSDNVELRTWGEPTRFEFEPRDHLELGAAQGWLDFEGGTRLAGSRNYVLKGDLSLLEGAVMRFALEGMVAKGFVPLSVPTLVRKEAMIGTGYFPGGEDQCYRTDERDDLCLVGTAEVPITALHAGEILPAAELPKRYVALSSCYRREAGTYGKDTKGLYRVHQFQKVEQVVIDVADEARSVEHHASILANAEEVLRALELPYRVVNVCGGDLGAPQVQKFDIETWMPSRGGYGETHSASRFHDFQARRLNLRYRDAEGSVKVCHTLNNTVAASARMLIALLENHQRSDGTIAVPEPLRPYLGGRKVLGRAHERERVKG